LAVAPNGEFLAILTSYEIFIAVLPDSSSLNAPDTGPIRIKIWRLGETTHSANQSVIASAIWHPLGVSGFTIVTVTEDAIVRIWELNIDNKWSFDSPTLTLDLVSLSTSTSAKQDLNASVNGRNRVFSPDAADMEVASACFGGIGQGYENGWAPMTLWLAMKGGDVYALCPLLPTKWKPAADTIPNLSISVTANYAAFRNDPNASEDELYIYHQQEKWISDIDAQDPVVTASLEEVYSRPRVPGPIPKLQGPFYYNAPEDDDLDDEPTTTDIYVVAGRLDRDQLGIDDEEYYDDNLEGVSIAVVCLLTNTGRVHVCLDLNGVEGKWPGHRRVRIFAALYVLNLAYVNTY
jgi:nucleoporin NUP82